MAEQAVVKKVEHEYAILTKSREEACAMCAAKNMCSVSSSTAGRTMTIRAMKNGIDVKPGDIVEIEVPNFSATKLSFLLYGLPLIAFIATMMGLVSLGASEGFAVIVGLLAVAGVYLLLSIYDKKNREKLMPRIIRKVGKSNGSFTAG